MTSDNNNAGVVANVLSALHGGFSMWHFVRPGLWNVSIPTTATEGGNLSTANTNNGNSAISSATISGSTATSSRAAVSTDITTRNIRSASTSAETSISNTTCESWVVLIVDYWEMEIRQGPTVPNGASVVAVDAPGIPFNVVVGCAP
jgi:hypothetical protein